MGRDVQGSWLTVVATASLALGLSACNASGSVSGGDVLFEAAAPVPDSGCAPVSPDAGVATFTEVYSQIINGPPGCNGCHTPPAPTGNLDMSTQAIAYTNLVGKPPTSAPLCASETSLKLVDPGNACNSLIYLKVTGPPCGSQMPLGGTPLTPAQYDLIGTWINAGAKND
jgi:hypothetical protein